MDGTSFFDLFCEAFQCPPEDFNEAVFWVCVIPQAVFLARLLWRLNRRYFKPDFELIEQIKKTTDRDDVWDEYVDFYRGHPPTGLLRNYLRVRVSGGRLMALADKLFAAAGKPLGQGDRPRPLPT
jgi:hypothetical protein